MIFEMPNRPSFFLMENGDARSRADVAISLLYEETSIIVKRPQAKLILEIDPKSAIFYVLWTSHATAIAILDRAEFKFWFTDEEDYALALLVAK